MVDVALRGVGASIPTSRRYRTVLFEQIKYHIRCWMFNVVKPAKSPKFRHAPASAGAGSAKAGIQKWLNRLDSRLRGNDRKG